MFLQNLKSVAGVHKKIAQSLDTLTLPFLQNFNGLLFGLALYMYPPNLKSVAIPVPEIRGGS